MKKKILTLFTLLFILSSLQICFAVSIKINNGDKKSEIFNIESHSIIFIPPKTNEPSSFNNDLGKFIPLTGNLEQLKVFCDELKNSATKKIHVIHYGDSQIQGDIITEYIREELQDKFGGRGAGYLAIESNDIKMRFTTIHTFSDDWNFASVITRNPEHLPFGISGSVAVPKPGSWVQYKATNELKSSSSFEIVKLYYSNADASSTIQYSINENSPVTVKLNAGNNVQELVIDPKIIGGSIKITFVSGKQPYIYGVSLESGNGVYVDNFPMPGNTGASLLDIPLNVLKDFNHFSNYKLIILSYGNNVSLSSQGMIRVYENKMLSAIKRLQTAFPEAGIILFSVNDKTVRHNGSFVSDPGLPLILETQNKIISKTKVGFWNLWEAMGGKNSMNKWVNANPPMALKDYAHFTSSGGKRVAGLFIQALMEVYSNFEK